MRVKFGVKERFKKNWRGVHGLVMWEKWEIKKTGKESRCPEGGVEMEARKTEIAMGDCIKRDLERVGETWGK